MTTEFNTGRGYNLRVRNFKSYENSENSENSTDELEISPIKKKPAPKVKRVKTEPKVKIKVKEEFKKIVPPNTWKIVYDTLKCYRKKNTAPVDTMGCSKTDNSEIKGKDYRLHVLLSLILSSRTKDETTYQAMQNIKTTINGPFNIDSVSKLPSETLHSCINKVGFHNQKLKFIQKSIKVCLDDYNGDIPDTLEGLTSLPGVGPKMAYLILEHAWGQTIGIGVDIHVHRITNRLKWVKTNTPEGTRESLESWLPREYWGEINGLLVGFGQTICEGQRPKCTICPVRNYCPSRKGFIKEEEGGNEENEENIGVKMEVDNNKISNNNGAKGIGGEPKVKLEYEEDEGIKMGS